MSVKMCKTEDLAENDILAADVMTSEYQVLLSAGTRIKKEYIIKLEQMGIKEVRIENDEINRIREQEILKDEVREKVSSRIKVIMEKHIYNHNEELKVLCNTADTIIGDIMQEDQIVDQVYDIKNRKADIYEHSVNICALSVMIALKLGIEKDRVHDIGVGCLLHDIGLRYLSISYENRYLVDMSVMEQAEYKKHPIYGYTALKDETWLSDISKKIILYHHERIDGSGYPLKARDIPVECKIVQVCDAFDELICGIACKPAKVYEAIEYLKVYRSSKFDPEIVDILLEFIAVYPVGTCVRTSDGEEAIVLHQNPRFSDRPVIRIVKDKDGNPVSGIIIKDMLKIHTLFIEDIENE
jgi:HD-GYP domain-containing protein (c-di-GMP phosphodiesterase class II)